MYKISDIYFPYFSYSDQVLNVIWDKGLIVLDTNTLLNTYKMENEARNQFFGVLKHVDINEKLWMPFQVGWEFFRNRKNTIDDSLRSIFDAKNNIKKQFEVLHSVIDNSGLKYHEDFMTKIHQDVEKFKKSIDEQIQNYNEENKNKRSDFYSGNNLKEYEPIVEKINEIYTGKYSFSPGYDELISLYKKGEYRLSKKIPPGFEDNTKGDYKAFGDFIIWEEMIHKSKEKNAPIIFVTEDHKKDWWLHNEKTQKMTPLPELLKEFHGRTSQWLYMYSYKEFIEEAKKRFTDLPETDKATKQMGLATQEKETKFNIVSEELLLQDQMNNGNSSLANKAYQHYLRLHTNANVYNLRDHVRKLIYKVGDYNQQEGLNAFEIYDDIIKESNIEMQIAKLTTLIDNLQEYLDNVYESNS